MKQLPLKRLAIYLVCSVALGCHAAQPESPTAMVPVPGSAVDLDEVIHEAGELREPVVLHIGNFAPGGSDHAAAGLLKTKEIVGAAGGVRLLSIDLGNSRNRAECARYHLAQTPLLLCLSPAGWIISRDPGAITKELVIERLDGIARRGQERDTEVARYESGSSTGLPQQLAMAEFLLSIQNDREAIPWLFAIAQSQQAELKMRVRAWVALARAHLWVGEPEKGRYTARDLIATLGMMTPDAVAGGNLVLGLQDVAAKRFELARQELQIAILAAPDSTYAKDSQDALAQLQGK